MKIINDFINEKGIETINFEYDSINTTSRNLSVISKMAYTEEMNIQQNMITYYEAGISALRCIEMALSICGKNETEIKKIMDFACGHGPRVLRMIKARYPEAELFACDNQQKGIDFCFDTFNAIPILSALETKDILKHQNIFNLIWNGSLLTHFDKNMWPEYLKFFSEILAPQGILVFTTCGNTAYDFFLNKEKPYGGLINDDRKYHQIISDYNKNGFAYAPYSDKNPHWGVSFASPSWIFNLFKEKKFDINIKIVSFNEAMWHGFNDVIICMKS